MTTLRLSGQVTDVLVHDDGCLVLTTDELFDLRGIAAEVITQLNGAAVPSAALADHLDQVFGAPPGTSATDALQTFVDELASHGILTVGDDDA